MQSNIVREVSYEKVVVDKMNANFRKVGIVLGLLPLILFIAVIIIIDNTVRLAMFSNRLLIKTMQMVSATRWFIAHPFDKKGNTYRPPPVVLLLYCRAFPPYVFCRLCTYRTQCHQGLCIRLLYW